MDDPSNEDQAGGTGGVGISGFFYDAVRLSQDETKKFSPDEIRASVTPTIFYRRKEGDLVELVEVLVRLNRKVPGGRAILSVNRQT